MWLKLIAPTEALPDSSYIMSNLPPQRLGPITTITKSGRISKRKQLETSMKGSATAPKKGKTGGAKKSKT